MDTNEKTGLPKITPIEYVQPPGKALDSTINVPTDKKKTSKQEPEHPIYEDEIIKLYDAIVFASERVFPKKHIPPFPAEWFLNPRLLPYASNIYRFIKNRTSLEAIIRYVLEKDKANWSATHSAGPLTQTPTPKPRLCPACKQPMTRVWICHTCETTT
jgi:hypothetical protein